MPAARCRRCNARRLPALAGFVFLALLTATAPGQDTVILRDGTVLKGRQFREKEQVFDKSSGTKVVIDKAMGLEGIVTGQKYVFFSTHQRQVAETIKDDSNLTDAAAFKRPAGRKSSHPIPQGFGEITYTKWDKNWRRTMRIDFKPPQTGFETIEQAITRIDPQVILVASVTHTQTTSYATTEWLVADVLALLATHPDLVEQPGKPDVLKRLRTVEFLKDVGVTNPDWLIEARKALDKVKKDVPEPWTKEAGERFDKLKAEIGRAEGKLIVIEVERAMQAGRYNQARSFLGRLDPTQVAAADLAKATELKAGLETIGPQYDRVKVLLRVLLDDLTGAKASRPRVALGGAAGFVVAPSPALAADVAVLAAAGEVILTELHPDTTGRLDLFKKMAEQAEALKGQGGSGGTKPESLLAVAASGWAKGKNGAGPDVAAAARAWAARQMCIDYFRDDIANNRAGILRKYKSSGAAVPFDELAQIITLLPPVAPEDPKRLSGEKVPPELGKVLDGIWKYPLPPTEILPKGGAYLVRLPDEYHPGRAYPLVIAISHSTVAAEQTLSRLAYEANRNGYVLVAPVWGDAFNDAAYDYSGKEHPLVLAARRDAMRRFQIDTDRVVLFGLGEGANFATDVALSHPDQFAALATFGSTLKMQNMFRDYWPNAQKLPVYAVTGDQAGPSFSAHYELFQNMLRHGFPSLLHVYLGRNIEWYQAEVAPLFDWLANKKRVTGTGVLRVGNTKVLEWKTMRRTDDRFYWIGCPAIEAANLLETNPKKVYPAGVTADIRPGNLIAVTARGLKSVTLYLERDMIDWTKPVSVLVNANRPSGFKPTKIEPSLEFMLEEFVKTGDKKMLFLNKLEFPAR